MKQMDERWQMALHRVTDYLGKVVQVFGVMAFLTACEPDDRPGTPMAPSPGSLEAEGGAIQGGGQESIADPVNEPMVPGSETGSSPASDRYPVDVEADDRVALIVTGLDGRDAGQVVSPWLVVTRLFRRDSDDAPGGDGDVQLTRYSDDFPLSAHREFFTPSLERCRTTGNAPSVSSQADNPPPTRVAGGTAVIINTGAGPWHSLSADSNAADGQGVRYRADNRLNGGLPGGASLSIPGDEFPNIPAHALFEPEPVHRLEPEAAWPIPANGRLRWLPGDGNTRIRIDWMAFDDADEFVGYPVSCDVIDDGEYRPDADTLTVLTAVARTHRLRLRFSRIYARLDFVNGVAFFQESEVAE